MKYLKKYKNYIKESLNPDEIDSICQKYGIQNYTINHDGTVDVDGNVNLSKKGLTKLPLKFNKVSGHFYCHSNQLTSLEGCPQEVGVNFYCYQNKLTSLEGGPKEVGSDFSCHSNQLTSLEGCPREVGGNFWCSINQLISLEGVPQEVGGAFYCHSNQINILKNELEFVNITGEFDIEGNPIYAVYRLFDDFKLFKDSLDYNYFREPNLIVKHRFEEACEEAGIKIPKKIKGYQYI
jgi:hypothetical protein